MTDERKQSVEIRHKSRYVGCIAVQEQSAKRKSNLTISEGLLWEAVF